MMIQTVAKIQRSAEWKKEVNDCTVRALARRIKTSYNRAHELAEPFRKSYHKNYKTTSMLNALGLEDHFTGESLGKFLKNHPVGCFYVSTGRHSFVVDQNKVYDDGRKLGLNTVIKYYA